MGEIILKTQNDEILASSLEVAEHFGKEHKNVLQSIDILTAENSAVKNMFHESTYMNSRGREYPEYLMNRDGFTLLVMGFTGKEALEWKLKYIEAFNNMEKALKNPVHSYQIEDPIERAKLWIKEQEEKKALQENIKELAPKVLFADSVEASKDSILIGQLAKLISQNGIEIGQNRLFDWMRNNGYLIRSGENRNQPTQYSMELGLMEIKKRVIDNPDGSIRTTVTTKITGKGQVYFVNKFLKRADVPC